MHAFQWHEEFLAIDQSPVRFQKGVCMTEVSDGQIKTTTLDILITAQNEKFGLRQSPGVERS